MLNRITAKQKTENRNRKPQKTSKNTIKTIMHLRKMPPFSRESLRRSLQRVKEG